MSSQFEPLVTIAIPTYNRADTYLSGAIESALRQTYPHVEILVADNASPDETPALVEGFDDDRLRYVRHSENLGPLRNIQICLGAAQGEFRHMLHDDDLADPDFLESCVDALAANPDAGYVRTGLRTIDADGNSVETFPNQTVGLQGDAYVYAWLNRQTYWYFSSTLLRTAAFRSLDEPFTRYKNTSDCANFARLAFRYPGINIEAVKASCRDHEGKWTQSSAVSVWIDEYERLRDELGRLASEGWTERIRDGANDLFSEICYGHAARIPNPIKRSAAYVRIYRAFEGKRIPPVLARTSRRVLPSSFVQWGQELASSTNVPSKTR
jgi:glycosyltransferase involved in cell wall biosynthesis